MTYARPHLSNDFDTIPRMPSWVTGRRAETPEEVAFLSGAALATLHVVIGRQDVPQALLRDRLALRAAEACVAFSGRSERAGELRDAVHLLRPGDRSGPAGEVYLAWQRAAERPISVKALHRSLPYLAPEQIGAWLDAGQGAPIPRAASVLQAVLQGDPRAHATGFLLADAALAESLGWAQVMPLLGLGFKRGDLRATGDDLQRACHRAVVRSAIETARDVAVLTRSAARLRAVTPKLRAKGANEAAALFLSQEAVAPAALTSLRSDRAARRFCDRLVELGAVRELTGRDTFRLYGV